MTSLVKFGDVHRGHAGGFELGFSYRSRLVALSAAESEALGVILAIPSAVWIFGFKHASNTSRWRGRNIVASPDLEQIRLFFALMSNWSAPERLNLEWRLNWPPEHINQGVKSCSMPC
jgi:hypothetical protein